MLDAFALDPSSVLIAFFELPRWTQATLLAMAAVFVFMNSFLSAALWSRRKARLRAEELTIELADVKARLSLEMRWRQADEQYNAARPQTAAMTMTGARP